MYRKAACLGNDVHLVLYVPFLGGLAHPAKDTYTFTT